MRVSADVTGGDPLAGLDDVPWAELRHSYGMADDVPGHLRAMQAGDWEGRYPPGLQLANHIVHQGTRSQAAVFTVPFLVRMALDPWQASRHGSSHCWSPSRSGWTTTTCRAGMTPRKTGPTWRGCAVKPTPRPGGAPKRTTMSGERSARLALVLADAEAMVRCYDAVMEALPALTVLLNSDSPELRAMTANLLAWFPEFAAASVPLLTALVAGEDSPARQRRESSPSACSAPRRASPSSGGTWTVRSLS
jgi:hypothetical protein